MPTSAPPNKGNVKKKGQGVIHWRTLEGVKVNALVRAVLDLEAVRHLGGLGGERVDESWLVVADGVAAGDLVRGSDLLLLSRGLVCRKQRRCCAWEVVLTLAISVSSWLVWSFSSRLRLLASDWTWYATTASPWYAYYL